MINYFVICSVLMRWFYIFLNSSNLLIFLVGRGGPMGGPGSGGPGGRDKMEAFFSVPAAKCGLVIGKGILYYFY